MRTLTSLFMAALVLAMPVTGFAAFPEKPVKIMVASTPGGFLDLNARVLGTMLTEELKQPVIVSNHPGGNSNVGINTLLGAPHDGYAMLVVTSQAITYNPVTMDVRYTPKDFRLIAALSENRMGVITQPDRPWKTLDDAFEWAKKENRPLILGAINAQDRDTFAMIAKSKGVAISPVPQGSGSATVTAVMGKHVDVGMVGAILVENTLAGKLKTIASTGTQRFTKLPDVPTFQELGYPITEESLHMLVVPADVPEEAAKVLSDAVAKVMASPEYTSQVYEKLQLEPVGVGVDVAKQRMDVIEKNIEVLVQGSK